MEQSDCRNRVASDPKLLVRMPGQSNLLRPYAGSLVDLSIQLLSALSCRCPARPVVGYRPEQGDIQGLLNHTLCDAVAPIPCTATV